MDGGIPLTPGSGGGTAERALETRLGPAVLLLAGAHFAAHADRVLPAVVAPVLQARFGASDGAMGLLLGPAFVGAYIFGTILAGAWVDRVRRYRLIAWSLVVWSLASAALGLAQSWEHLLAARLVVGLGQAALAPAALSILLQETAPGGGGRKVAAFTSGAALGRSGALLAGGALLALFAAVSGSWPDAWALAPWRLMFLLTAIPNLILAILLFRKAEPPPTAGARQAARGDAWGWARHHRLALGVHLIVSSAAILLTQALGAWAPSLFVRAAGLEQAQSAMLAGVVVLIAGPAGHFLGGGLIDRMRRTGHSPAGALAIVFLPAAPCAALLGAAEGPVAVAAAFFALALVLGAAAVAALASFQPLVPGRLRGAGNAVYFATVSLVGLGLGPPLVGFLSDSLSLGSQGSLGTALALVTAGVALPAALLSYLNRAAWSKTAAAAE
ncbi:MAG: MFS transporter [Brevundimonas sp.]